MHVIAKLKKDKWNRQIRRKKSRALVVLLFFILIYLMFGLQQTSFLLSNLKAANMFFFCSFWKLFMLLVNGMSIPQTIQILGGKKIPAAVWCPRIWSLSRQMKEEKRQRIQIKSRAILSFFRLAFTSHNKEKFMLIRSQDSSCLQLIVNWKLPYHFLYELRIRV